MCGGVKKMYKLQAQTLWVCELALLRQLSLACYFGIALLGNRSLPAVAQTAPFGLRLFG
jgi:hypothetical protein